MSSFVPSKRNLRESLLFCFHLKKKAAEGYRMLLEAYGDHAPSISTCEYWFRRFKSGDFDVEDKERPGQPKRYEDEELEALLDEDPCQCEQLLARYKRKSFLHRIVTGDEKWIHYDNPKRKKSWGLPGHASTSTAKPNKRPNGKSYPTRRILQTSLLRITISSDPWRTACLTSTSLLTRKPKIASIRGLLPKTRSFFDAESVCYQKDGKK